jgi:GntR family transcriptional repressor for pyruvate dehydrogenase complex
VTGTLRRVSAPRLERRPLSEQVADGVIELIRERGLGARDTLPGEAKLAASFGVSRPIVREALRSLAGRGVLEIVNGRGAVIRPVDSAPLRSFFERAVDMDPSAVAELMEIRKGIEVQAARLAAQRRTKLQLDALRSTARAMRRALGDPPAYVDLDTEFHLLLAQATDNALIVLLMRSIRDILRASIDESFRSRTDPAHIERAHVLHERLVEDLQRRDAEAAAATMTEHFDDAMGSLRAGA